MPVGSCTMGQTSQKLPARRIFRGQDTEGSQTSRFAGGATEEVRTRDQSQDREADRTDDPTECAGAGDENHSVRRERKKMKKKIFGIALGALLFALWLPAEGQQAGKVHRVGILDRTTVSNSAVLWDAFRQEMRKLGWIEGKNIEYRFTEEKNENLPELAENLVRSKVDLMVVTGIPLALAAKKVTTTIPIVITNVSDPVGAGLVASLARPGAILPGSQV